MTFNLFYNPFRKKEPKYKKKELTKLQRYKKLFFIDLDGIHGLNHSKRVYKNCIKLSKMLNLQVNSKIFLYFAFLHDVGRFDDEYDKEHGQRSYEVIKHIKDEIKLDKKSFKYC